MKKVFKPKKRKSYESPQIITYSSDDILEELGPAQACSPFAGSSVPPDFPGYAPGLPPFHDTPSKKKRDSLFD